jgi:hypothetical protein
MAKKKRPLVDRLKTDIETQKGYLERLVAGNITHSTKDGESAWRDSTPVAIGRTKHMIDSLEDALKFAEEHSE